MTEKRFKLIGDSNLEFLMQDKLELPIYDYDNNKKRLSLKNTLDLLNSLNDENEQLKQFKKEVFKLIDKRIDKCEPTDYARTIKGDYPVFDCETATEIRVLKELKMELQE